MRQIRWNKNFEAVKYIFSPLKRWKKLFQRYQQNLVKNNFSAVPAECGEKKFFSATSRMRWRTNSLLKEQIFQILTANFNAYLKFTGNHIKLSDGWCSGIRSCWHAGGEMFEPVYDSFFFCRKSSECGENNFHCWNLQILTKFHSIQR